MSQIILYGAISGFSLVAGALGGLFFKFKQKTIASLMAFGTGVLICALTFGLMEEAFNHGGFDAVIIGFALGGIVFILGDYLIHRIGGRKHRRRQLMVAAQDKSQGRVITLGAVLDGIPEAIALGIALYDSQARGLLMLVAIVLNNLPESLSSVPGLRQENHSNKKIIAIWTIAGLIVFLVSVFSYQFLSGLSYNTIGILEAFAAGAILAMVADTMLPEAFEEGGFIIGFLTVLGFLTAFLVSRI